MLVAVVPAIAATIVGCQGAAEPQATHDLDDSLALDEQRLSAASGASGACDPSVGCSGGNSNNQGGGVFAIARPLVSRVVSSSRDVLRGLVDAADALPALALNGVRTCRDEAVTCLDAAVTNLDTGTCAASLDGCVDGVVDIIDPVLDPLPGPNASGIVAATGACRTDARDCLTGALTLTDINACSAGLGACIDGLEVIVNDTVDDVNVILDPLVVPKPENAVDCTLELAQCLADFNNPFDCAEQARICASQ